MRRLRESPGCLPLEEVLISEELARRPARPADPAAENRALKRVAGSLGPSPDAALQALLDEALVLCRMEGVGTSGVSLLEVDDATGDEVFLWTALAGRLASHVGGTTPRDFSPCGACLDAGGPILLSRPDLRFTYFQDSGEVFVEGLVLPFTVDGRVAGTIWVVSHDEERRFDAEDVRLMSSLADFTGAVYALLRSRARAEAAGREKERVLSMVSHDLRTPLNAIGGYADLLDAGVHGPLEPAQAQDVSRIRRAQRQCAAMIDDLLVFTRSGSRSLAFSLVPVHAREEVAAVEEMMVHTLRERRVELRVDVPEDLPPVRADRMRFRQVLLNLMGNAARFTRTDRPITVSGRREGSMVFVDVTDTGPGIPEDQLDRIFEPFVQLGGGDGGGSSGLGLWICREVLRGMGGGISVRSSPGEGSTFSIRLPEAEPAG